MTPAFAVWLTGPPACGKSTIARALVGALAARGVDTAVLESDVLRRVLTPRPTYSEDEREGFYRALVYIGSVLVGHGAPVVFDATANRRAFRDVARAALDRFVEVYVDCPIDVCVARDPKGIYRLAQSGRASTVPGVQSTYEPPLRPEVVVSGTGSVADAVQRILGTLEAKGYIGVESCTTEPERLESTAAARRA